jgi:lipid-A-disaccharide synthase
VRTRSLLLVAGEVSGDIHGGNLLGELRRLRSDLEPFGIGGERLSAAGLECLARSEQLSHMGLAEVVRELPSIRRVMRSVIAEVERRQPDVAVLIDSPDFNLRLARHLNRLRIPVILYVSPQLWAWRRGRVRTIRRRAREVLCILPFEVDFYDHHRVPARYVGHPLVDDLARDNLLGLQVNRSRRRLGLLPGSRAMEIQSLLPAMLEGVRALRTSEIEDVVLLEAPGMAEPVSTVLGSTGSDPRLRRVSGSQRRLELASCGLAWTASGTATLECALLDVPMIVGYRLHPVTFALARMLVRVPHVALVNLIAGAQVAPELIQRSWTPSDLCLTTRSLMSSGGLGQRAALAEVRSRLGAPGASLRAAEAVAEHLG